MQACDGRQAGKHGQVGFHELSTLQDRTLLEVTEAAWRRTEPAVNKGGTA